jgi:hypothetical protein
MNLIHTSGPPFFMNAHSPLSQLTIAKILLLVRKMFSLIDWPSLERGLREKLGIVLSQPITVKKAFRYTRPQPGCHQTLQGRE